MELANQLLSSTAVLSQFKHPIVQAVFTSSTYDVNSVPRELSLTYLSTNWVFIMYFCIFVTVGLLELIWWGNEITIATDPEQENPLYVVQ